MCGLKNPYLSLPSGVLREDKTSRMDGLSSDIGEDEDSEESIVLFGYTTLLANVIILITRYEAYLVLARDRLAGNDLIIAHEGIDQGMGRCEREEEEQHDVILDPAYESLVNKMDKALASPQFPSMV